MKTLPKMETVEFLQKYMTMVEQFVIKNEKFWNDLVERRTSLLFTSSIESIIYGDPIFLISLNNFTIPHSGGRLFDEKSILLYKQHVQSKVLSMLPTVIGQVTFQPTDFLVRNNIIQHYYAYLKYRTFLKIISTDVDKWSTYNEAWEQASKQYKNETNNKEWNEEYLERFYAFVMEKTTDIAINKTDFDTKVYIDTVRNMFKALKHEANLPNVDEYWQKYKKEWYIAE